MKTDVFTISVSNFTIRMIYARKTSPKHSANDSRMRSEYETAADHPRKSVFRKNDYLKVNVSNAPSHEIHAFEVCKLKHDLSHYFRTKYEHENAPETP
jgi:hypothetical protein